MHMDAYFIIVMRLKSEKGIELFVYLCNNTQFDGS